MKPESHMNVGTIHRPVESLSILVIVSLQPPVAAAVIILYGRMSAGKAV